MTTTKQCSQCKKDIDGKVKKCPHCQSDLRSWFARHKILTGIGGFILFVVTMVAIGDNNSAQKKAEEKMAMEKINIEQKVIFDTSNLLWKDLAEAKKVLGEPTKVITSENPKVVFEDTDAIWKKEGEELYVNYVIKTGKIKDIFLIAKKGEDRLDDADNKARIVRKMNLSLEGKNYKVEFPGPKDGSIFTGAKVVLFDPLESLKNENAKFLIRNRAEELPLKAPSTAKWDMPSYVSSAGNNTYKGYGSVDSQNGFGAMIRSSWSITVKYVGPEMEKELDYINNPKNWKIISIVFDGKDVYKSK